MPHTQRKKKEFLIQVMENVIKIFFYNVHSMKMVVFFNHVHYDSMCTILENVCLAYLCTTFIGLEKMIIAHPLNDPLL